MRLTQIVTHFPPNSKYSLFIYHIHIIVIATPYTSLTCVACLACCFLSFPNSKTMIAAFVVLLLLSCTCVGAQTLNGPQHMALMSLYDAMSAWVLTPLFCLTLTPPKVCSTFMCPRFAVGHRCTDSIVTCVNGNVEGLCVEVASAIFVCW